MLHGTIKDDEQYELVEYACHEGNYGMTNILEARPAISGTALREALAAEGAAFGVTTVRGFLRRHGLERARRLARLRARRKRWTEQ